MKRVGLDQTTAWLLALFAASSVFFIGYVILERVLKYQQTEISKNESREQKAEDELSNKKEEASFEHRFEQEEQHEKHAEAEAEKPAGEAKAETGQKKEEHANPHAGMEPAVKEEAFEGQDIPVNDEELKKAPMHEEAPLASPHKETSEEPKHKKKVTAED